MELREATADDLSYLREETKKYLPKSLTILGIFEVGFRFGSRDINRSKVYFPKYRESPFFIFVINVVDISIQNACCFWDTSKLNDEETKDTLKNIPNWDWTKPLHFSACSMDIIEKLNSFLPGTEGLTKGKTKLSFLRPGSAYLPVKNNDFVRFSDEEFEIKRVDPIFADHLFSYWKNNYSDSTTSIRKFLEVSPSAGAFLRKADNNEEYDLPVAWTLLKHNGEIGLTTTVPDFRNLGLATGVTKRLVNICLQEGLLHYMLVGDISGPSIRLHENLGYQNYGRFGWIYYFPEGEFNRFINYKIMPSVIP